MKKFYNINKKYLADGLSFLGFRYFKFQDADGKQVYAFEDTEEFKMALNKLFQLKNQLSN